MHVHGGTLNTGLDSLLRFRFDSCRHLQRPLRTPSSSDARFSDEGERGALKCSEIETLYVNR